MDRTCPTLDRTCPKNQKLLELANLVQIRPASELSETPRGLPTGVQALDLALPWGGLPVGHLTAFIGAPGSGRMKLWTTALSRLHQSTETLPWAAWLESESFIYPPALAQMGVELQRLLLVKTPAVKKIWSLRQALQSRLFQIIGCDGCGNISQTDLQKLAQECRQSATSVVLFFEKPVGEQLQWLFKLRVNFNNPEFYSIEKAQNSLSEPLMIRRAHENTYSLYTSTPAFHLAGNSG